MFNVLDIDNPFYINNNFDFSSDSDSESDDIEMSAANMIHTAGSSTHKELIQFFKLNKISENTFDANQKTIKSLFDASEGLWKVYKDSITAYSNDDTEEMRLTKAKAIGAAAVKLRESQDDSRLTIIRASTKEVTIAGLSAAEIVSLKELHDLVLLKMQGNGQKGNAEKANQMVREFKDDMELAKTDNTFPAKWIKNHGIWKCVQHEAQHGRNLEYTVDDAGVLNKEKWALVVAEFNKHKDDAVPAQGTGLANASNKFAVDVYCAAINRYKATVALKDQSKENFLDLMKMVSAFLNKSSIKKSEWLHFIKANSDYKSFLSGLDEANYLYDNPGKLTRARLYACASSLYSAPEPLSLFGVENRLAIIPKMIAKIYEIEKKFNVIDKQKGTTSTSEHLCHLLLTLGSNNPYVYNRNEIPSSIRDTKFHSN